MNQITNPFLQSELDYHAERIRVGLKGRPVRRNRVRRPRASGEIVR